MPSIIFSTVLLIILGIEQFGIPLVLLAPWGEDVLTTYLYSIYNAYVSNPYPRMAVVASIMLYITVSLLIVQRYIVLRESRRFVTIGERAKRVLCCAIINGCQGFSTCISASIYSIYNYSPTIKHSAEISSSSIWF